MTFRFIKYENQDGVGILTLNRPEMLNALKVDMVVEMLQVVRQVKDDNAVRALLLTGAGRGFCAGADLAQPEGSAIEGRGEQVDINMQRAFNPIILELDECPKPVLAAVNGVTAGGGVGLALSADIVLAAESAKFIQVFAPRLGIIPDMGSTWYLTHLLGRARARGLALTGEPLSAQKAEEWGLIYKCVPDASLMQDAMAMARRLADCSTKALEMTMAALDAAEHNDLKTQLDVERYIQTGMINRDDFLEGVAAFFEKREPRFRR